jgi:hypothetical protein
MIWHHHEFIQNYLGTENRSPELFRNNYLSKPVKAHDAIHYPTQYTGAIMHTQRNEIRSRLAIVIVCQSTRAALTMSVVVGHGAISDGFVGAYCIRPSDYPFIPNNRIAFPPRIFSLSASEIPFIALIGAIVFGQVEIASP